MNIVATKPTPFESMSAFFAPRSIALVGISRRPDSFTARALRFLRNSTYAGSLYLINPKYSEIDELTCYKSLEAVPGIVDLVICMVPADQVLDVVRQAGVIGAKAVSIFAAGFAESGEAGVALQNSLASAAKHANVLILGPNCQGTINFHNGTLATFQAAAEYLPTGAGDVAYLGQSGAVGGSLLNIAQEKGLGFSLWASTGNQVDVSVLDLCSYAIEDDQTRVLALYLEDVTQGKQLQTVLRKASAAGKRTVIMRTGRSISGRRASRSHTGTLQGEESPGFDSVATAEGAVVVTDVDALLDVAASLSAYPRPEGTRLGVITTSGAAGILVADMCADYGLSLDPLSDTSQRVLRSILPDFASVANPVDVTYQFFAHERDFIDKPGGVGPLEPLVDALADSGEVDIIILVITMLTGDLAEGVARDVRTLHSRLGRPMILVWLAGEHLTAAGRDVLRVAGIPVYGSVRPALEAAHALVSKPLDQVIAPSPSAGAALMAALEPFPTIDADGFRILDALQIPYPAYALATNAHDAHLAARSLRGPLAVKLQIPGVAHKQDVHAVALNVPSESVGEVAESLISGSSAIWSDIPKILVQEMVPTGIELLVGATYSDQNYPALLTIGIGGRNTEAHRDSVTLVATATESEIVGAINRLRASRIFHGFRGDPPYSLESVAKVASAVGMAVTALEGRLTEFEINPLILGPGGAMAVDIFIA